MPHLVFVFGTLKTGFPNHHYIAQQTLVGEFTTEQAYPLYLVGDRYSPWMMDQPGQGLKIRGQVYKVDDLCLTLLDRLERTAQRDGYCRQKINVVKQQGALKLSVYCYLKPASQLSKKTIRCGPIAEYLREHASQYRSRFTY